MSDPNTRKKATDGRLDIVRTNVRMACALRGMGNYSEIARRAGFSRNLVTQFINNDKSITYENLLLICDVINVPIGLLHIPDSISQGKIQKMQETIRDL